MTRLLGRRMSFALGMLAAILGMAFFVLPQNVFAAGLQIRPLLYNETLQAGETKKGFVDVSNASDSAVTVELSVQGFKQTDDAGDLQFFSSPDIAKGIPLDLQEVHLKAREAVRVYFLIDSKKLPQGDVLAAIFASTKPSPSSGIATAARVGTLLVIANGTGAPHSAAVTQLSLPMFIFANDISGSLEIKNTADPQAATGFFPTINLTVGPLGKVTQQLKGPLVTTGVTRQVPFHIATNRIGFYKVSATAGSGDGASRWVFVITGWWRSVVVAVIGAIVLVTGVLLARKRQLRGKQSSSS